MAATSPYTQNDYQAVSTFRPYQLPVNDIFKGISAQDRFWDIGAERVKNVYDKAAGLDLITDDNKRTRDQYLVEAQKQITKLSSMDLSDPSIQREGFKIFQPLFKDENIVGEDYVVKTLNRELSIGMSDRRKDGGKNYNPISVENLNFERTMLGTMLNKKDGWRSLYGNLSTYTPNYDSTAEIKKIQDVVKAEEIKTAQLSGDEWYKTTIEKKGVSKERMQAAIQEMGSPQLKAQLRSEGRNAFYKKLSADPGGTDLYFQALAGNLYDSKIQDLRNNKAEIDYQNYMTPDKSDNKAKKDALTSASNQLNDVLTDLVTTQKPKYMQEFSGLSNLDNLSSSISKVEQLWQSSSTNHLASKLAYMSSSVDIEANPVKIAKENNRVAIERINLGYQNLAEDKRHNLVTEEDSDLDRQMEMLKLQGKLTVNANGDPLFGFGGGSGGFPTSFPAQMNEQDRDKLSAQARENFFANGSDEHMRQLAISSVLGQNAWAGIQQNIKTNAPVNQVLTEAEIDNAAKFFKAFTDKYGGKTGIKGVYLAPDVTEQELRNQISQWNVGKLKLMMGNLSKHDTEFTGDLIGKIYTEDGPEKAANFRARINESLRNDINLSTTIFSRQPLALADYAKYFDNGGKTTLTDDNIKKAYQKGLSSGSDLKAYFRVVITHPHSNPNITEEKRIPVSEKEYLDYQSSSNKAGQDKVIADFPTLSEFNSIVRKRTDPIFYQTLAENNVNMVSYSLEKDPQKFQKLQAIPNMVAAGGTDKMPEIEKIMKFIKDKSDKVQGYNVFTPQGDQTLPTMEIVMDGLSKDDAEEWEKLKGTRIPIAGREASMFQKGSASGTFRYPGAVLTVAPMNNPEGGMIRIINSSRDPSKIDAEIHVDNIYGMSKDSKGNMVKTTITSSDIKRILEAKFKMPIGPLLETYLDEVNTYLSGFVTNLEQTNKK